MIDFSKLQTTDYPGYYVTVEGRVFSDWVPRKQWRGATLRELKPRKQTGGYFEIAVCRAASIDGKQHNVTVHRLVLTAFRGHRPNGTEARHLDGDRSNNRLDNLEWGDHTTNMADQRRHGTLRTGAEHPMSKANRELRRRQIEAGERAAISIRARRRARAEAARQALLSKSKGEGGTNG